MICSDNKTGSKRVLESAFWAWDLIGLSSLSPLNWSQTEELSSCKCIPSAHPLWGCSFLREAQRREKCQQSTSRSFQENKQVIGHVWAVTLTIQTHPPWKHGSSQQERRHEVEGASSKSFIEKVGTLELLFYRHESVRRGMVPGISTSPSVQSSGGRLLLHSSAGCKRI